VRSASVVGMVGAGGIGLVLWDVIRGFQYAQTAAVLLLLVISVGLIDLASAWLRRRLV
jgi:phosphonate transport system permease protein